ncbi:MAG: hypothetical protein ACMZ64_10960 [Oleiphilus sp.]
MFSRLNRSDTFTADTFTADTFTVQTAEKIEEAYYSGKLKKVVAGVDRIKKQLVIVPLE